MMESERHASIVLLCSAGNSPPPLLHLPVTGEYEIGLLLPDPPAMSIAIPNHDLSLLFCQVS
jgi:hypothetical protein